MKFISFITITFIGLVQTTSGLTKDVSKIIGDPSELLDCDSIEKEGARLSCLRADIGKLYNLVEALEYIEDLNQATPNDIQKDQAILVQEEGVYYYSPLALVWLVMKTMCCYCCCQYLSLLAIGLWQIRHKLKAQKQQEAEEAQKTMDGEKMEDMMMEPEAEMMEDPMME